MTLDDAKYDDVVKIYSKFFSLGYINADIQEKFALISLTCYVTYKLRQKNKALNTPSCYDVLCKIGKDFPENIKNSFFKSLGAICEDFMYGCDKYPDFGIKPKEMPITIKKLLDKWIPF